MSQRSAPKTQPPLQIVILGGTGDLTVRKLLPALIDLYAKSLLPQKFSIIGTARSEMSDTSYQEFAKEALKKHSRCHKTAELQKFCKHLRYVAGTFDEHDLYLQLRENIRQKDQQWGTCSNKLFYLAVPPEHYATIFSGLHLHKLHKECDRKQGWARVLVEKPFGSDYQTAQELDKKLGRLFREEQIYRIDHYLAKEAVQNILSFRFANRLLAGSWNNLHIKQMKIMMHETVDIGRRGSFYDGIGALRDVGQNHLLQLLALLTMRAPTSLNHTEIRKERARILCRLVPVTKKNIANHYRHAQYTGYKKTAGVAKGSQTETYFELIAKLNDPNWRDMPIYISAGKGLGESKVEVEIDFWDIATGPFETAACLTTGNKIKLIISPQQSMQISLNAKAPGLGYQLESRTLTFDCATGESEIKNAYEKVLFDCISGDQTLFTTTKEVQFQWRYINSVLRYRHLVPLLRYKKGSRGPSHSLIR